MKGYNSCCCYCHFSYIIIVVVIIRKFLSIKESMGHLKVNEAIIIINKIAKTLFEKRLQTDRREAETTTTTNPLAALLPSPTPI